MKITEELVDYVSELSRLKHVLRADEIQPSYGRDALLAGAPASDGEAFLVPRAVE